MLWMVVGAMWFGASLAMLALLDLQKVWMIFLLLPSMRVLTLVLIRATFSVWCYEAVSLPIWAHFARIREHRWLSTIVLPVVSIYTHLAIVIIFTVRTPYSLEVEHIEVHVNFIIFNKFYRQLLSIVGEGTKFLIIAFLILMRFKIRGTKFGFVFIWVIKFLYSVMSSITSVTIGTLDEALVIKPWWIVATSFTSAVLRMLATSMLIWITNMGADLWLVSTQWPPTVLVKVVIEGTALKVMVLGILGARMYLECVQIEELYALRLA